MANETQTPNPSSSDANVTSIGGNVTAGGDFVGRDMTIQGDQVQGDKVSGDKVLGDKQVIIQRLDPSDARNQRNHKMLRQMVRTFWVGGVLKSSLYNEVLIRLNMEERPNAVDNRPWDLILKQPGQSDSTLPSGLPIIDIFDRMNQLLLTLGEPGSGKTTTLLELADALLKRAESDPTHPTPVVFNLSSWAEKWKPLEEWLVDELRTKYNIPKKVAQQWIADDELLPLLDGLDEVRQEHREDCVKAINQFRQEHLVPMAVCSRTTEYESMTTQLKLQGAVLLQPLTLAKIDSYLKSVGLELPIINMALQDDSELQELITSPLVLSIMVLAHHGVSTIDLSFDSSSLSWRQNLFDIYTERMFSHRSWPQIYPVGTTIQWLSWLAKNMNTHQQTIFTIESLQSDWLQFPVPIQTYRWVMIIVTWLIFKPEAGLFAGVISGIGVTQISGPVFGLISGLISWMIIGMTTWQKDVQAEIDVVEQLDFDKDRQIGAVAIGLISALFVWYIGELVVGLLIGLSVTLYGAFFAALKSKRISQTGYPNEGIWRSARNMWVVGFLGWLLSGLLIGLLLRQSSEQEIDLTIWLILGLILGMFLGWRVGMRFGGKTIIKHVVLRTILWIYKFIPLNYARFLDDCHKRLFLRKVGGGYIFIHRMLMEHFANMTDDDIKRLAADIEASRS